MTDARYEEPDQLAECEAEIERLRGEAERRSRVEDERSQRAVEMEKEIERLRDVMRRVANELGRENEGLVEMIREALGERDDR